MSHPSNHRVHPYLAKLTIYHYSGVPIVEATESPTKGDDSRAKREAATADALAKAKAMVEAENAKKTTGDEAERKHEDADAEANRKKDPQARSSTEVDDVATAGGWMDKARPRTDASRKRGRDEVEAGQQEEAALPEAKRVDTKEVEGDGKKSEKS